MTSTHHDKFFKKVFSDLDVAQDFLDHYLPSQVRHVLALDTLKVIQGSFVDRRLKAHYSDLVYQVDMNSLRQAYVCILMEHKSYLDRWVPVQLLRYMVQIWGHVLSQRQAVEYLPVIIPLVIYHGPSTWRWEKNFSSLFAAVPELTPFLPDYRYLLCDLSAIKDEDVRGAVKTRMTLFAQKHFNDDDLSVRLPELAALSDELTTESDWNEYLDVLVRYLPCPNKLARMILITSSTGPSLVEEV
ncbi:MAG: Rpn family recombination-promoting nuclease/putative transposase [Deltaproteobacteria bacterium]|nr:Rpn family recombination-promoting nuclease/putative transposase [Deltaproteobacteria bacterium]